MIEYIIELTDNNFSEFTKNGIVLVDIKAEWCQPCKQLSPIIGEISNDFLGKVLVGKLDADSNPETISLLGIRSVPTLILYKDGNIIETKTGMMTKQKISELINNCL